MRLWIDEDLSPALVVAAHELGVVATCNRDRRMLGRPDADVARAAALGDAVLVTDNRDDFRALYDAVGALHPGLVFLPGDVPRDEQVERLRTLLDWIRWEADRRGEEPADLMVNKLVEMDRATLVVHIEWLPDTDPRA